VPDDYPLEVASTEPRLTPNAFLRVLRAETTRPERHIYLLQGTDRRLTIHAQQTRALNLVYSLSCEGAITSETKVRVVGGGFAGLTAAVAASYLGGQVTLFERRDSLLHLQTGSYTRWVHPHIYDWPDVVSDQDETDLPFLNWWSTTAAEVAKRVLDEFVEHQMINGNRLKRERPESADLEEDLSGLLVGGIGRASDVIILATGFGTERTLVNVPFRSYWMSDALHQPTMLAATRTSEYLISGTGDGGLIDLLRLKLQNFRQDLLVKEVFSYTSPEDFQMMPALMTTLRAAHVAILAEGNEAKQLRLLERCFTEIARTRGFEIVRERLAERLRGDTVVHLHGRDQHFLSPQASMLHTFLAFVLKTLDAFEYYWGPDLKVVRDEQGFRVTLPFDTDGNARELSVRDVIVRHGPVHGQPGSRIAKLVDEYRRSLSGRIAGLDRTALRVQGNTNAWWSEKGVKPLGDGTVRRVGVSEMRESRETARRSSGLLEESVSLQRSLFVRGAIGEFINGPMYDAFHDLVYSYRDADWERVEALVEAQFGRDAHDRYARSKDLDARQTAWTAFGELNASLSEGSRRYHPAFFQGSEEERRLDQVLEYFNMIGSYWTRHLLKDEDIEPLDSYILLLLDRKAIKYYLDYSARIWQDETEIRRREPAVPFSHLRGLLKSAADRRAGRGQ
jgi:hypothetical protein